MVGPNNISDFFGVLFQQGITMIRKTIEIIIGTIFIASAFAKLYDFSNTIQFIISIFGLSYDLVKVSLILLSLLEFGIGISFLINIWNQSTIIYSIIILLGFFILINIYFLCEGLTNCGCFGTQIESSPLVSLIKNLVITSYLLYSRYSNHRLKLVSQ
jgi:uncharacterized membrane protein YphA (DoxX/SURF4 family)